MNLWTWWDNLCQIHFQIQKIHACKNMQIYNRHTLLLLYLCIRVRKCRTPDHASANTCRRHNTISIFVEVNNKQRLYSSSSQIQFKHHTYMLHLNNADSDQTCLIGGFSKFSGSHFLRDFFPQEGMSELDMPLLVTPTLPETSSQFGKAKGAQS